MVALTATQDLEVALPRPSRRGEPTWEMALLHPLQGTWSESEYLALHTNRLIEYADGCLEFLPMPTLFHQAVVLFLYSMLNAFVRGHAPGEVSVAPCRVRTLPGKYREPDIFYVRPERVRDRNKPTEGADLAMEVVSGDPDDRKRDLEEKRDEYARGAHSRVLDRRSARAKDYRSDPGWDNVSGARRFRRRGTRDLGAPSRFLRLARRGFRRRRRQDLSGVPATLTHSSPLLANLITFAPWVGMSCRPVSQRLLNLVELAISHQASEHAKQDKGVEAHAEPLPEQQKE
jgi:hypothetical protein